MLPGPCPCPYPWAGGLVTKEPEPDQRGGPCAELVLRVMCLGLWRQGWKGDPKADVLPPVTGRQLHHCGQPYRGRLLQAAPRPCAPCSQSRLGNWVPAHVLAPPHSHCAWHGGRGEGCCLLQPGRGDPGSVPRFTSTSVLAGRPAHPGHAVPRVLFEGWHQLEGESGAGPLAPTAPSYPPPPPWAPLSPQGPLAAQLPCVSA